MMRSSSSSSSYSRSLSAVVYSSALLKINLIEKCHSILSALPNPSRQTSRLPIGQRRKWTGSGSTSLYRRRVFIHQKLLLVLRAICVIVCPATVWEEGNISSHWKEEILFSLPQETLRQEFKFPRRMTKYRNSPLWRRLLNLSPTMAKCEAR